ncbi:amidohydrolase [[Leptolyngbya] sp. PCC 7376]|uniref:M20 metallopeptidase family protein n=1 Tax=[Leptolyngbya] sp. PCC 7376 TaxID=111781 RepID=UPI00029F4129|nr:M20 family metallopeptidase [[Leptolyngbya] sp. PCC 7376]AFY36500.1 amidohydrolase [[Leptolyngbya] sp. PCC 7376]
MVATVSLDAILHKHRIRPAIQALQTELVEWRRTFHKKPELAFRENLTAEFIAQKLTELGIDHQTGIAKTGIVAVIKGKDEGKVLGIRADMDALPIQEENEVDYCSQHDGVMHACGHDGHVAIALGTAKYLSENRDSFNGTVKIIFQPAEESPGGAKPMIEEGVLKNPDVDAIIGLHIWNNLPLGTVGVRPGALMAAAETFHVRVQGKGGHGALPHQTKDAIVIGSQIVTAFQTVVARSVNPIDSAVVTVGEFHAGDAHNVIADFAELSGTVRYFNPELRDLRDRLEAIINGVCHSYGATYELDYIRMYPPTINDPAIAALVKTVAEESIETPLGVAPECQTMGSEDMSYFLQEVPGCYFFLGSANPQLDLAYPHHHPRFNFDESALGMGVEMFVRCVEKFLA